MLLGLLTGASFAQRGRAPMGANRGMTQMGPYPARIQSADTSTGPAECHTDAGNGAAKCHTDAARDDVPKANPTTTSEPDYWRCHHLGNAEDRAKCHTAGCQADASHRAHQRPVAPPERSSG